MKLFVFLKNHGYTIVCFTVMSVFTICCIAMFENIHESVLRNFYQKRDGWEYVKVFKNGEEYICLSKYNGRERDALCIPGQIDETPVREIGSVSLKGTISTVIIPKEVEVIHDSAFLVAQINAVEFEYGSRLKELGGDTVFGQGEIECIELPDSVETIGEGAFELTDLREISLGSSLKKIGDRAFSNTKIQRIRLSENNQSYEYKDGILMERASKRMITYDHEKYSEQLVIPSYIESIDITVLDSMNLQLIEVENQNPCYISIHGCLYSRDGKVLYKVPCGMEFQDSQFADSVETIGSYAFEKVYKCETVDVPETVKVIEPFAFDQDITVPKGLEFIDLKLYHHTLTYRGTEAEWNNDVEVVNYPDENYGFSMKFMGE